MNGGAFQMELEYEAEDSGIKNVLHDVEAIVWPQSYDSGNAPGGLYGVTGIPGIITFDPDNCTIERDGYPWLNLLELNDRLGIWEMYGIGNAGGGRFLIDRNGKILAINPDAEQVEAILKDKL